MKNVFLKTVVVLSVAVVASWQNARAQWEPAGDRLMTPWAEQVEPVRPLPNYPRPQMVRQNWGNLNGLWDYAIRPKEEAMPKEWDGKILVPYPVESALSGVGKTVGPDQRLWYRTGFEVPEAWRKGRLLIHFGAVDWHAAVWINGRLAGEHHGGYTPFAIDATKWLREDARQELTVSVWDPTDAGFQPRGKQVRDPNGIWYTAVTGIWQTIWMEPVPEKAIGSLRMVPDIDEKCLYLTVNTEGEGAGNLTVRAVAQEQRIDVAKVEGRAGERLKLSISEPMLWSPESPFLYTLKVELADGDSTVDEVDSYFGMRKISMGKDKYGFNRIFLNNEPYFMYGPLDQGWWPDGLYTAPTDDALKYDIRITKQLGFNAARKHVKVEPARWYYWCDVMGLAVWQDMPNGDRHIRADEPDIERTELSEKTFRQEWKEEIDALFNHPSIVVWVPFNEGWGQFKTDEILAWTEEYDPSRLVDGPSGWADRGTGDMVDMHAYPGPAMPSVEEGRIAVLGEFGGLGLPLEGHLWWDRRNWGYRTYQTREELWVHYEGLMNKLFPLIGNGLAAAIYTQTTDVEGEVNGLMTYDRKVVKFDMEQMRELNRRVYQPYKPVKQTVIVPASREEAQTWRYTTEAPGDDWHAPETDVSSWKEGPGGFGTADTPGSVVGTEWSSSDIWIRREFELENIDFAQLSFLVHHDEDVDIYLNGEKVASYAGYVTGYEIVPCGEAALKELKAGKNVLAAHCRQTGGGQFIDIGLVDLRPID